MSFIHPQGKLTAVQQPRQIPLAIPSGQFIEIDERFYEPELKDNFTNSKRLGLSKDKFPKNQGFVSTGQPLSIMIDGSLKDNYGNYIYNQITGFQ